MRHAAPTPVVQRLTRAATERDEIKECSRQYEKSEDDLKSLQSVGQIIGEVLRQLDEDRCEFLSFSRFPPPLSDSESLTLGAPAHPGSHRQGLQRPSVRGGLPE